MFTLTWVLITIILIYLIKLIVDYRKWVKNFYNWPSYTLTFSDYLTFFKGSKFITKKWASRKWFRRAHELTKNHDYFIIWIGFWPMIWLIKPKIIEAAFKVHNKKTIWMKLVQPFIRNGLTLMDGDHKWRKFRKIGEANLRTKMLHKFFPIMSSHCDSMVQKLYNLGEDTWSDLNEEVSLTTFNVICETSAGVSTESDKLKHSALKMFEMSLLSPEYLIKRLFNPLFWPEWSWVKYANYVTQGQINIYDKTFKYLCKREIARQLNKKQIEMEKLSINKWSKEEKSILPLTTTIDVNDDIDLLQSNQIEHNFLTLLVNTYVNQNTKLEEIPDDDTELITPEDVLNEINNFFLAGFDTVRTGVLWTLSCLACEPTMQQRLYDELIEVFGEIDDEWTFDMDKMSQLTFLDCCVREGLRLFSPIQALGRNTDSDHFQIDEDHCLPPNTEYVVSIYSAHHDETIYPEPEKFNPDRWLGEKGELIPSNYWFPFGSGPRICVGYRFALHEMKIILASIMKHFTITTNMHYDEIDWNFLITLKPLDDVKFKVKPRRSPTTSN